MLHTSNLPPKQMRHHFRAVRPSIQHRSSGNSAAAAAAPKLLSATQHLPASKHDAASPSICLLPPMLQASNLSPKQMRHHFWAQRAPTQHRSSGNSAAAAPATVFAAFGHDPGALSCCLVSRALQTTQLPPKQMHSDFWANVRHKALFALQLSISSTSTTALCASIRVWSPHHKVAALHLICWKRPRCQRIKCAAISGLRARCYAVNQRKRLICPCCSRRHRL